MTEICTKLSDIVNGLEKNLKDKRVLYARAYTKLIKKVKKLRNKHKGSKGKTKSTIMKSDSSEDLEEVDLEDLSQLGRSIDDVVVEPNISLVQEGAESQGRFQDQMGFHMAFKDAVGHTVKDTVQHIRTASGSCCNASRTKWYISEILLLMICYRI